VPFVFEEFRDDINIVKNRVGEAKVGPKLFYPLVGQARVVESHWQCEVFYKEIVRSDFPFPIKVQKNRAQVVYIDKAELAK
jgi:hypothetical protein